MARNWVRREHLWTLRLNSKTGRNKTGRMVRGGGVSKRADLVGLCDRWWLMVVTVHQTRGSLKKRKKVLGVSLQYGRRWFWGYLWRADLEQTELSTGELRPSFLLPAKVLTVAQWAEPSLPCISMGNEMDLRQDCLTQRIFWPTSCKSKWGTGGKVKGMGRGDKSWWKRAQLSLSYNFPFCPSPAIQHRHLQHSVPARPGHPCGSSHSVTSEGLKVWSPLSFGFEPPCFL